MIEKIFEKFQIEPTRIVTKSNSKFKLTFEQVVKALLEYGTLKEAALQLGLGRSTLQEITKQLFPDKRSRKLWGNYLYESIGHRLCKSCNNVLPLIDFPDHKVDRNCCTKCMRLVNQQDYIDNKDYYLKKAAEWRKNNPDKMRAFDAIKRARKRNATPEDADLAIIQAIYADCFEGYHVDHIIPLSKGGLHHQENLCWLPAALNLSKHNKMPEEVPEIMAYAIYPNLEAYG